MLATGGGDAVINLWHDSTADEKEEAFRKEVRLLIIDLICISIKKCDSTEEILSLFIRNICTHIYTHYIQSTNYFIRHLF